MVLNRDLMLVVAGRLTAALVALITIRAVTTFLTPEQYGELALFITVQMFCGLFLINPIGQHVNLHTHLWWDEGSLVAWLESYRYYVFAVSLVGGVLVLSLNKQSSIDSLILIAVIMIASVVAGTWNATLVPMLNMLGFRAASVLWSIITVAVSLVSSIFLVVWLSSASAWFAGQTIGMALGAVGARHVLRRNAVRSVYPLNKRPWLDKRTILAYCFPLAVATGFMWMQLSGYRLLIEHYWGLAQLGFIAIGLQLAGQVWALIESLAMQFLYPLFYRRISEHEKNAEVELALSDLLNTLVPVYLILTGLLVSSAPYLLKLLVAPQFQEAITFVVLGAGIELCRAMGNLLSNAAHVRRKAKSLTVPYAVGSMTTICLIYVANAMQLQVGWTGVALMAGSIVMLIVMWIGMYRQVRFTLDLERWLWGLGFMLALVACAFWLPPTTGLSSTIGMLLLIVLVGGGVGVKLLWNNPALHRLLKIQLTKN